MGDTWTGSGARPIVMEHGKGNDSPAGSAPAPSLHSEILTRLDAIEERLALVLRLLNDMERRGRPRNPITGMP